MTPSQLIAESQALITLPDAASTPMRKPSAYTTRSATKRAEGQSLSPVIENVESQLTNVTNFPSSQQVGGDHQFAANTNSTSSRSRSSSSSSSESMYEDPQNDDEEKSVDPSVHDAAVADIENFFDGQNDNNNNDDHGNIPGMRDGLDDLNDYSSDQFSLSERRSYFMDRQVITAQNRSAVEFVYMIEAESLTRQGGTKGKAEVKTILYSKYIELIRAIPSSHFGEWGLREAMIERYYGAKKGGASGFYLKVVDVKKRVQAVTRKIDGIGTPLSKIPSGRGIRDVIDKFILDDYKAVMGVVSICLFIVVFPFKWIISHQLGFHQQLC